MLRFSEACYLIAPLVLRMLCFSEADFKAIVKKKQIVLVSRIFLCISISTVQSVF